MPADDLYLQHHEVIEKALAVVCRRHRLGRPDCEDFSSTFRLHLLERDCAPIRRFEGRCSMQTFLVTVVSRFFQDWRNARWGKWRPSAEAKRLGQLALDLEVLVVRDRMSLDEAYERLRAGGSTASRAEIEALAARFPQRHHRAFVSDVELETAQSPAAGPDASLLAQETGEIASFVIRELRNALDRLASEDRLIVQLLIEHDRSIADVARMLKLDQRPLYRRVERLFAGLRADLQAHDVSPESVARLLEFRTFAMPGSWESGEGVRLNERERPPVDHGSSR